jgi:putative transcriptional regulator
MATSFDTSRAAPTHHPSGELLLDYAAGAMSSAEALLMEMHIQACAECRKASDAAMAIGGSLLDTIEPAHLPPSLFQQTLQAIDALDMSPAMPVRQVPAFAAKWPSPLRRHLATSPLAKWRKLPAGFRALRVPFKDTSSRVWIMDAPGGRGPLRHGHVADEWTVVIEGGFTDETGTYAAGDFALMGSGAEHTMIAEPGEGCVCAILIRENARYLTLTGKLLAPFLKL